MLLAGDVGGTKTVLGIFSQDQGPGRPLAVKTYPSAAYPGLDAIVEEFLASVHLPVQRACFDVAGPVAGGRAELTNLPWKPLRESALADALGLGSVRLLNDLEAIALGITQLPSRDLRVLHRRKPAPGGTIAVVAPGTGLGEAFCTWDGHRYVPHPSEGGHGDFAPGNQREADLLAWLRRRHGHVSWELVCSGMGIPNLYDFLVENGSAEPEKVAERIATAPDRTRAIVEAGLDQGSGSALCAEVLELFAGILGAEAGNMALTVLATGGIYLAGGIPPAILPVLRGGRFLERLHDKGRLSAIVAAMPVSVVTGQAALIGAATAGFG
ncbi:MAG TPA: glucokinase [Actinomycetes bacterium]|jgi:glucokinase|nr:glucokinase [Actinomycetes bacterium]